MKRLAIIDDYQGVALQMADWSSLDGEVEITVFRDTLAGEDALAERLRDFEIVCIMRERTPFPRSLFEKLPKLEHLFTSGMRNRSVDLAAARDHGVVVTGTPTLDYPTPELAWGLIIACARQIPMEDRAMHEGRWAQVVGRGLKEATLGIIGLGRMGSQVARVGLAFGMTVLAWSPNLTAERCAEVGVTLTASKRALLEQADFVTLHVMLGERSRGMIGADDLAAMKPTAYLINTSRGPVVDEAALVDALAKRTIAGAALDVYDTEPLPADHPLRGLPNAILMPHQGYVTEENYRIFYGGAVQNVRAWLDGTVINQLTEATGPQTHRAG